MTVVSCSTLLGLPFHLPVDWIWEAVLPGTPLRRCTPECSAKSVESSNGQSSFCEHTYSIQDIVLSCDFINIHHRCCFPRLYLDSSLQNIWGVSEQRKQRQSLLLVLESVSDIIRRAKSKPIVKRSIRYRNILPSVFRWCEDDTTVYSLTGRVILSVDMSKIGLDRTALYERALDIVPEFVFMSPLSCCKSFVQNDLGNGYSSSSAQLLALQGLEPAAPDSSIFIAAYSPFSWIVSCSGEQVFSRKGNHRVVAKRQRSEHVFPVPTELDLRFELFHAYVPRSKELLRMIRTLHIYKPSTKKEEIYGVHEVRETEESLMNKFRQALLRRTAKLMQELDNAVAYSDGTDDQDVLCAKPTLIGVLGVSRPIKVEKCLNQGSNQLVAVLPNDWNFSVPVEGYPLYPTDTLDNVISQLSKDDSLKLQRSTSKLLLGRKR